MICRHELQENHFIRRIFTTPPKSNGYSCECFAEATEFITNTINRVISCFTNYNSIIYIGPYLIRIAFIDRIVSDLTIQHRCSIKLPTPLNSIAFITIFKDTFCHTNYLCNFEFFFYSIISQSNSAQRILLNYILCSKLRITLTA